MSSRVRTRYEDREDAMGIPTDRHDHDSRLTQEPVSEAITLY
jgi:hypothetical protein